MHFLPVFNNVAFPWRQKKLSRLIDADDVAGLKKFLKAHPRAVEWVSVSSPNQGIFLHAAVEDGKYNAAKVLLEHGARTDKRVWAGHTALQLALNTIEGSTTSASPEQLRMAQLLLDFGADINRPDENKRTPLALACWMGNVEAAQFLLDRGADPKIVGMNGMTLLHDTLLRPEPSVEIARIVMSTTPDVNAETEFGMTPLFYAHEVEVARMLLEAGADPEHVNHAGTKAWSFGLGGDKLKDFIRGYRAERAAEAKLAEEQRLAALGAAMHEGVPLPKTKPLVLKKGL